MKAIVYQKYGSPEVLELKEVEKLAIKDDGVLIRVLAASVNRSDWEALTAHPRYVRLSAGFLKPRDTILGSDIAGRVEAGGGSVTQFRPGDEVFGDILKRGLFSGPGRASSVGSVTRRDRKPCTRSKKKRPR